MNKTAWKQQHRFCVGPYGAHLDTSEKTRLKMNLNTWDHNDHRPSIYKVEAIDIINKTSAFITSHPSQSVQCF